MRRRAARAGRLPTPTIARQIPVSNAEVCIGGASSPLGRSVNQAGQEKVNKGGSCELFLGRDLPHNLTRIVDSRPRAETPQFRRATAQSVVGVAACPLNDEQVSLVQCIAISRLPIEDEAPLATDRSETPLATNRRKGQARIINA